MIFKHSTFRDIAAVAGIFLLLAVFQNFGDMDAKPVVVAPEAKVMLPMQLVHATQSIITAESAPFHPRANHLPRPAACAEAGRDVIYLRLHQFVAGESYHGSIEDTFTHEVIDLKFIFGRDFSFGRCKEQDFRSTDEIKICFQTTFSHYAKLHLESDRAGVLYDGSFTSVAFCEDSERWFPTDLFAAKAAP